MTPFDQYQEPLARLRDLVPWLVELLDIEDAVSGAAWKNLDARLLPLLDPRLPLMVAICGGANSGKSTLFNSLLKTRLSVVRGNAGSTRRVLVAGHPEVLAREDLIAALFDPFGQHPRSLEDPAELLEPGPPLFIAHPKVPPGQILMDTPDFDTGTQDRYTNRDIAREVLEACNVLIYIVTNTTYNNLENTRFMRRILTETGMRRCILVYSCSRTLSDSQVRDHLS
ncbi:MAG: GTPase, partial [Desulfobacterales bacterium]